MSITGAAVVYTQQLAIRSNSLAFGYFGNRYSLRSLFSDSYLSPGLGLRSRTVLDISVLSDNLCPPSQHTHSELQRHSLNIDCFMHACHQLLIVEFVSNCHEGPSVACVISGASVLEHLAKLGINACQQYVQYLMMQALQTLDNALFLENEFKLMPFKVPVISPNRDCYNWSYHKQIWWKQKKFILEIPF